MTASFIIGCWHSSSVLMQQSWSVCHLQEGFNRDGRDRDGFDIWGYKHGFDRDGYDREGYDAEGYNRCICVAKPGSLADGRPGC